MKRFTIFLILLTGIAAISPAQTGEADAFRQEGVASWYGTEFDGKPTASGEIFNSGLYTAAHPRLPFGTILTVTNKNNMRKVTVRINDRGPFVSSRIIDISKAAAEALDMLIAGTSPVILERAVNTTLGPVIVPIIPVLAAEPKEAEPESFPVLYETETAPEIAEIPEIESVPEITEVLEAESTPEITEALEAESIPEIAEAPKTESVPEIVTAPETERTPAIAEAPRTENVPEIVRAPETVIVPETTRTPEVVRTPEPTRTPEVVRAPEIRPAPVPVPVPVVTAPQTFSVPAAKIIGNIPRAGSTNLYRLQVGAYKIPRNATDAFDKLKKAGLNPAYEYGGEFYRVVLPGLKAEEIESIAQILGNTGYHEALIREEKP